MFSSCVFYDKITTPRCGKVFDSDDGGGSGGDEDDEEGGGDDVAYDKFGNVIDKAAAERAALQELRETARAARAAKVNRRR